MIYLDCKISGLTEKPMFFNGQIKRNIVIILFGLLTIAYVLSIKFSKTLILSLNHNSAFLKLVGRVLGRKINKQKTLSISEEGSTCFHNPGTRSAYAQKGFSTNYFIQQQLHLQPILLLYYSILPQNHLVYQNVLNDFVHRR